MWKATLPVLPGGFSLAVALAFAPIVLADTIPKVAPGNKLVPIKSGGKTAYIQVRDSADPFKNVKSSGASDSDQFSFNKTSRYADQTYVVARAGASSNESYQQNLQNTFITKSYFDSDSQGTDRSLPGLGSKVPMGSAEGYLSKAAGYDKTFLTASARDEQKKSADFADKPSDYQGRAALLGGHDMHEFSNSMANKTYEGPEASLVKRDVTKINDDLVSMKDLPNRPLTVDEVRALINHGVKPDLGQKAAEPSKALNEPEYTPDQAPAPLRDSAPGHLLDENDTDSVPAPGMMGHPLGSPPENSEALPH